MASPAISVLMTTYNSERYVAESIESVLNQTFSDFELIINDDQSRDGTLAIAQRYARLDPRIRVSVNDRNYGDYANRRLTAALARWRQQDGTGPTGPEARARERERRSRFRIEWLHHRGQAMSVHHVV